MQRVLTCAQMREAEEFTCEKQNITTDALMERAGAALAELAAEFAPAGGRVLVVCGGGNNGGDGYCAARLLCGRGLKVRVLAAAAPKSAACIRQSKLCPAAAESFSALSGETFDVILECLYGTGFHGELPAEAKSVVDFINRSSAAVIAADIPAGLNGDSGIGKNAVRATVTAAIGALKAGHVLQDGRDCCGELRVCDIGLELPQREYARIYEKELRELFPKRKSNSHKGDYGRVAAIGGSERYSGAPLLSAGALRAGAGYLRICVPDCIFGGLVGRVPEAILTKMPSAGGVLAFDTKMLEEAMRASDCIAIGMGCCAERSVYEIVRYLLQNYRGTLVLDADALNALAKFGIGALENKSCRTVLTPHVKEFARLCGRSVEEVACGGIPLVEEFAKKYGVTVMMKSNTTIITDGVHTALNKAGTPALAKGGSGDVLAGIVAALCARSENTVLACACAARILGDAATLAASDLGEYGVIARDVIDKIPYAIQNLS